MYGVEEPENVFTYRNLREFFMDTLKKVASRLTRHRALVLLLDGLDHLSPSVAVQSLSWLPDLWPKHVHVVLTTDTADELSMHNLSNHISRIVATQFPGVKGVRKKSHPFTQYMGDIDLIHRDSRTSQNLDSSGVEGFFLEIDPLDVGEQFQMIDSIRKNSQRELTAEQQKVNLCRIYLILLETRIVGLHFAVDSMGLPSFKFFWWAPTAP